MLLLSGPKYEPNPENVFKTLNPQPSTRFRNQKKAKIWENQLLFSSVLLSRPKNSWGMDLCGSPGPSSTNKAWRLLHGLLLAKKCSLSAGNTVCGDIGDIVKKEQQRWPSGLNP